MTCVILHAVFSICKFLLVICTCIENIFANVKVTHSTMHMHIAIYVFCYFNPTGYLALNNKSMKHCAHCIFMFSYMTGYVINYGLRLLLTAEGLFIMLAVSFIVTIPPYLVAEWLSNRRSFTRCLGYPESHHHDDDI